MTQSFAYMLPERFMVVLTDFSFSNIIALGTRLKSRTFAAGSFPRNHEKSYRVTTNLLSCPYRCYCFSMASFPSSAYGWNNCVFPSNGISWIALRREISMQLKRIEI